MFIPGIEGPTTLAAREKEVSSRHSTRTTGSWRRRPSTSASAGPPSGAVSRRMGYTETAGANGRKPRSAVVVHHRSPAPPPDTASPFATPAVQQLIDRAMRRRRQSDSARGLPGDQPATGCQSGSAGGCGRKSASAVEEQDAACSGGSPTTFASTWKGSGSARAAARSSSRASGTGPGSSPAGSMIRSASSATSFRPPAPSIHWPAPVPTTTGTPCGRAHGDASGGRNAAPASSAGHARRTGPALIAGQLWIDSTTRKSSG